MSAVVMEDDSNKLTELQLSPMEAISHFYENPDDTHGFLQQHIGPDMLERWFEAFAEGTPTRACVNAQYHITEDQWPMFIERHLAFTYVMFNQMRDDALEDLFREHGHQFTMALVDIFARVDFRQFRDDEAMVMGVMASILYHLACLPKYYMVGSPRHQTVFGYLAERWCGTEEMAEFLKENYVEAKMSELDRKRAH